MFLRSLEVLAVVAALIALLAAATSSDARDLRVCSDPNNLPFSHEDGTGFENRIAGVLADEIGATVRYTWHASRRGFLRNTLNAGVCDTVIGVALGIDRVATTRPYYRSSYMFVQRAGEAPIRSYADPRLKSYRIGVQLVGDDGSNTPPAHHLARRGITRNVRGFMVYGDYRTRAPLEPIIAALATGEIDVAVAWGPVAGYFASREKSPLALAAVETGDPADQREITFAIAAGVRRDDAKFRNELDGALDRRRKDIERILDAYGVPRSQAAGVEP